MDEIKEGHTVTFSFWGENKSGDIIVRTRNDNKRPPFWGVNTRTGKRGKAIKLKKFTARPPYSCTLNLPTTFKNKLK